MTDPDLATERDKEKAGFVPSLGHVLTSPGKTGGVPPPSGSHSGIYRPSWSLTPKDLLSDHTTARECRRHAFPPTTIEALTVLADENMDNGLRYVTA